MKFAKVIREDIMPLLEDYCYEDYSTLEKILGKSLVDVKNQNIRHDLFDLPLQKDKLINALLAECRHILETPQAIEGDSVVSEEEIETTDNEKDK
jgi:5-methylcytosine-specific restriction protein B